MLGENRDTKLKPKISNHSFVCLLDNFIGKLFQQLQNKQAERWDLIKILRHRAHKSFAVYLADQSKSTGKFSWKIFKRRGDLSES